MVEYRRKGVDFECYLRSHLRDKKQTIAETSRCK